MNVQTETLKSLRKDIKPSLSPGFPRFLDPWWSLALSLALFIFPEIHRTQGPRNTVSAKDSLASLRIDPLRLQFEVFRQRGRDVTRAPVNADALRQTHQGRRQQCMICDVDRVAVCQSCFHLLGKNGCSREAANELKACFGTLRRTAHVGDDLRGNIAVA